MSQILHQVDELRQQAIAMLLAERQAIDEKLASLSYDGAAPPKKKICSLCQSPEHNARTCPQRTTSPAPTE